MSYIIFAGEADDYIAEWVAIQLGMKGSWQGHKAFGVVKDGKLIAGIVFNQYCWPDISMHVASDGSKKWLSRELLYHLFNYVFNVCKCYRVTAYVAKSLPKVLAFDEKIGFTQEGIKRRACLDGGDLIVLGMLKEECRFLQVGKNSNEENISLAA